uniref:Tyrosine specific protein phosphatases domain-containing protein n=1 Tax=Cyclophora tenuis TaxID=216820 RepID=A0A7S1D5X8_CYCTE|mmetsp:Transcript_2262/g.3927  ORF Transcript_2262/g.3927 Transcript_2262/m.3927 type:complete len:188 (+) Transcript_2262:36-599(+)
MSSSSASRPNDNTYWVVEGKLLAGEYPADRRGHDEETSRAKIRRYLDEGIQNFVDLTSPGDQPPYEAILRDEAQKKGVEVTYKQLSIQDFGLPSTNQMKEILDTIDNSISSSSCGDGGDDHAKKTYVHCNGGIGRTGTVVGCYLARHGTENAADKVKELYQSAGQSRTRPHAPETPEQVAYIQQWKE